MKIIETNLKFNSNYQERGGKPTGIVLHHAAANGSVNDVHNWHLGNGWAGIGYHFYVRKDGSVYRGRPENWYGAHTANHNEKIGICAEGNFEIDVMSVAQKNAIIELLDYLYDKYGKLKVYGHRDLDATACPGKNYPFNDIVNAKKEEAKEEPEEDVIYRVQVGAFKSKVGAETMVKKLSAAGFDAFIKVEGKVEPEQEPVKKKTPAEIAKEIFYGTCSDPRWDTWGFGDTRFERLKAAGYDPGAVQAEVNKLF